MRHCICKYGEQKKAGWMAANVLLVINAQVAELDKGLWGCHQLGKLLPGLQAA
jgi:hypothetical protein